jgi:competence protein ComEC
MRSFILGFVAGTMILQTSATLPAPSMLAAGAGTALLLLMWARVLRYPAARFAAIACAGVLAGAAWSALLAQAALSDALDARDEGRDLHVVGVVETLPYRFDQGVRFNLRVERCLDPGVAVPPHVALSWYAGRGARERAVGDVHVGDMRAGDMRVGDMRVGDVRPGQRWALTVRLQRPPGNANPGGLD